MRKYLFGIILLLMALSGCRSAGSTPIPPTYTPEPTVTTMPECLSNATPTFTDYATWTKVNPKPIPGHEVDVNIYVNDLAEDTYLSASGKPFPVCAEIVKAHLIGADSGTVTALTVMVKMPAGFDPEHNDWWWGMFDRDGQVAQMSGQVQVCIACHQPVAAADYVFSKKVIEEISK